MNGPPAGRSLPALTAPSQASRSGRTAATLGGILRAENLCQPRRLFAAAHGKIGFPTTFAADLPGKFADDFAGLVAGFDRRRRTKNHQARSISESGTERHNPLA
jgi:hypothetical protein